MSQILKFTVSLAAFFSFVGISQNLCAQTDFTNPNEHNVEEVQIKGYGYAAEAYFSPNGTKLIFQAQLEGDDETKAYVSDIDGTHLTRLNAKGTHGCNYWFPDGKRVIWTSTKDNLEMNIGSFMTAKELPHGMDLYSSDINGKNVRRLTKNKVYDAEESVSPDGKWILFTRWDNGNLDLYRMPVGGNESDVEPITTTLDWQEGGAFYLPDSETIIFRAWRMKNDGKRGGPKVIFTINHDGTGLKALTPDDDKTNSWSPYPAPDSKHYVYAKTIDNGNYEIYLRSIETGVEERLTYSDTFDGFPTISSDGTKMLFTSDRHKPGSREFHLYIMDISSLNIGPNF